jgi:chromosome transmission fidelity protein 1
MAPVRSSSLHRSYIQHPLQISDFSTQLVPYLRPDRISTFSCGHVIPTENLKTLVVTRGPTGNELIYKHQQQKDLNTVCSKFQQFVSITSTLRYQVTELGQILFNLTNLVPDGMVVFVPSYAFLNAIKRHWETNGMLSKFAAKKRVCWFLVQDSSTTG